jgi:hypothetical protein
MPPSWLPDLRGAALVYINPNLQWGTYNEVLLQAVEFWAAADSKVSPDDKTLTEYFYNVLQANLAKNFTLVNQSRPGVMTLRVALMDAPPPLRDYTHLGEILPQARVLDVRALAIDSYARLLVRSKPR